MTQEAQLKQVQFQVNKEETKRFAGLWTLNGISIPIDEHHILFATDFANVVLQQFIEMCKRQAMAKLEQMKAAQTAATPTIIEGT